MDRNEQCDDGNRTNFDACTNACERARCGDGIIREDLDENDEGFEACDDNNANDQDACTNSCARARCGDGIVRRDITNFAGGWEECDDGNIVQDDGCTRSCRYSSIADADGYIWDPTSPHGYLYNGTSDAWDGFGYLRVNNVAYRAGFESVDWARQVYTGQVHEMNGFRVTRRFYAARPNDDPNLRNFGRFYIRIENPSELPRSVNIHLTGNLGSDRSTVLVTSSSGDRRLTTQDQWLITDDADGRDDPSISIVYQGANPSVRVSEVTLNNDIFAVRWNPVSVPARGQVAVVVFVAQNGDRAAATAEAQALESFPEAARANLSDQDRVGLLNF